MRPHSTAVVGLQSVSSPLEKICAVGIDPHGEFGPLGALVSPPLVPGSSRKVGVVAVRWPGDV